MKLVYYKLNFDMELLCDKLNILYLENPRVLEDFIYAVNNRLDKSSAEVEIFCELDKIDFEKYVDIVSGYFDLHYDKKDFQKKFLALLIDEIRNSENEDKFYSVCENFGNIIESFSNETNFSLIYDDEFTFNKFFKVFNLSLENPKGYFIEKFIDYATNIQDIMGKDIFILVSCLQYMTDEDLIYLDEFVKYRGIKILIIEREEKDLKVHINKYIIDKDICEIY